MNDTLLGPAFKCFGGDWVRRADKIVMCYADRAQVTAKEVLETLPDRAERRGHTSVNSKVHALEWIVVLAQTC